MLPVGRLIKISAQAVQERTQTGGGLTLEDDNELHSNEDVLPPTPKSVLPASGFEPLRDKASSEAVELLEVCRCVECDVEDDEDVKSVLPAESLPLLCCKDTLV